MRSGLTSILVAVLTLCQVSGDDAGAETSELQQNSRFTVSTMLQGGFQIRDRIVDKVWSVPSLNRLGRWQLMPEGHWLSYEKVSADATISCLLDLKTQTSSCARGLALEPGEGAWSPSGRWLAWKSPDLTQLHFSDSESAELSKEDTVPVSKFSIAGDPIGLIWRQKWLSDDELLIGTGSGESVCYGIFDFSRIQFYKLACSANLDELSKATGNPEGWLTEKGLLAGRGRWRVVNSLNFPWEPD